MGGSMVEFSHAKYVYKMSACLEIIRQEYRQLWTVAAVQSCPSQAL